MPISCSVVHSIHDRVRLRADLIKSQPKSTESLQAFLEAQPGVLSVRINQACGSVIVRYDVSKWSPQALSQLIENVTPSQLEPSRPNRIAKNGSDQTYQKAELGLSTTAIMLGWLSESLAAPLVPWLLIGSAWSMFRRAYEAVTLRNQLNVDVLDAAATGLLTLQGRLSAAAFMVWLVNLADCIRNMTRNQSFKAIQDILSY